MHIWQICDIHARDFVGMAGQARPIRLEAVRAECDRTDDTCQPHDIQAVRHRAQPNFIDVTGPDGISTRVRF